MECSWKVGLRGLTAVAVLLIGGTAVARAQFAGPAMSVASASAGAPAGAMHLDYQDVKIMTGDVISIMTYGAPELSSNGATSTGAGGSPSGGALPGMKVGTRGEIVLPTWAPSRSPVSPRRKLRSISQRCLRMADFSSTRRLRCSWWSLPRA